MKGPPLGPWSKTAPWRGGSFLLGLIAMLWLLHIALGDLFDLGLMRLPLIMIITGVVLSVPYGMGWVRSDRAPKAPPKPAPALHTEVRGHDGRTVVVVTPPKAPPPAPGPKRAVKSKDLSPGWWTVYTVTWRWPIMLGDAILCGLWAIVGRLVPPPPDATPVNTSQIDHPEDHPSPESRTF